MLKKIIISYLERCLNKKIYKQLSCGNDIRFRKGASCNNSGNRNNIQIGNHGVIAGTMQALCGGKIIVGNNIYMGMGTIIQAKESVYIGNDVILATNVLIVDNNNHPTDPKKRLEMSACDDYMTDKLWSWKYAESKPIVIEDNVWIGRDAKILKGVTVGRGSIVAMASVVTKNVPPYSIVAGNPARVVRSLLERGKGFEEIEL